MTRDSNGSNLEWMLEHLYPNLIKFLDPKIQSEADMAIQSEPPNIISFLCNKFVLCVSIFLNMIAAFGQRLSVFSVGYLLEVCSTSWKSIV